MVGLFRTARAQQDLIEIWTYIAQDNEAAADTLLAKFYDAFTALADFPELGPRRDDIRPGFRYFVVADYFILYRRLGDDIEIVRIVHSRGNIPKLI